MGWNNAKPVDKNALIQVKRNLATKNLERDIKHKQKLISENKKAIQMISMHIAKQGSHSLDWRMYDKLLNTKKNLEDENLEESMKIDILSQHTQTSKSLEYLNETPSINSKLSNEL